MVDKESRRFLMKHLIVLALVGISVGNVYGQDNPFPNYFQIPSTPGQNNHVYPRSEAYNYSGIRDGEYSWGNLTIDRHGYYSGYDSEDGFIWGNIQKQ